MKTLAEVKPLAPSLPDPETPFRMVNYKNLIATAPELLAACESLLRNAEAKEAYIAFLEASESFDDGGNIITDYSPEMEFARAAIAKAKGEA